MQAWLFTAYLCRNCKSKNLLLPPDEVMLYIPKSTVCTDVSKNMKTFVLSIGRPRLWAKKNCWSVALLCCCYPITIHDQKVSCFNAKKENINYPIWTKWRTPEKILKHPFQDIPEHVPSPVGLDQIKFRPNLILTRHRSFQKGSAPGPTGTWASHILHAAVLNQT